MDNYFSRHTLNLDVDNPTRSRLWNECLVAIHSPDRLLDNGTDNESIDPNDYPVDKRLTLKNLIQLGANGGYVWAQYEGHDESLLGYVKPQQVKLLRGKWGSNNNQDGREAVLKTVQLSKVRMIMPQDYPELFGQRPRRGTLHRWYRPGDALAALVDG